MKRKRFKPTTKSNRKLKKPKNRKEKTQPSLQKKNMRKRASAQ